MFGKRDGSSSYQDQQLKYGMESYNTDPYKSIDDDANFGDDLDELINLKEQLEAMKKVRSYHIYFAKRRTSFTNFLYTLYSWKKRKTGGSRSLIWKGGFLSYRNQRIKRKYETLRQSSGRRKQTN